MYGSIFFYAFIALVTTTAAAHVLYAPNSYQNRLRQSREVRITNYSCTVDNDCGDNGYCRNNVCKCNDGYITWQTSAICGYKQIQKLTAFLVSFFVGGLGVDWFVLACGNGRYIAAGVFKLLMPFGCCLGLPCILMGGRKDSKIWIIPAYAAYALSSLCTVGSSIWWLVDWIRILANAFPDGNGAPLKSW